MELDITTSKQPIILRAHVDKVSEEEMARLVGTTATALKRKRQRHIIPPGVYATIDGRITYSIKRYDEWLESLWPSQQVLKSSAKASASASCGTAAGVAKPSRIPRRPKASKQPQVLELS